MIIPYCFVDYLRMKPGTLLGGFVRVGEKWKPSPRWELPDWLNKDKPVRFNFFLEHRTRWRQHLRKHSKMIGRNRIYYPPVDSIKSCEQENRFITINFTIDYPIGIYLGHIIRIEGVSLVNILTSEGYDIWI
jgi:hypothetical protein